MKPHVTMDEMQVQGDELIIKSLFLKDSSMFSAIVVFFLFSSTVFFLPPLLKKDLSHYINFFRSSSLYICSSSNPALEYVSYQASFLALCEW